jgi:hypothetical protein
MTDTVDEEDEVVLRVTMPGTAGSAAWTVSDRKPLEMREAFNPTQWRRVPTVIRAKYRAGAATGTPVSVVAKLVLKKNTEIAVHEEMARRVPGHVPLLLGHAKLTAAQATALFPMRPKGGGPFYVLFMEDAPRTLQNDLAAVLPKPFLVRSLFAELRAVLEAMAQATPALQLHDDPFPRNVFVRDTGGPPEFLLSDFGKLTRGPATMEGVDAWLDAFEFNLSKLLAWWQQQTLTGALPLVPWLADVAATQAAVAQRLADVLAGRDPASLTAGKAAPQGSGTVKRRITLTPLVTIKHSTGPLRCDACGRDALGTCATCSTGVYCSHTCFAVAHGEDTNACTLIAAHDTQ